MKLKQGIGNSLAGCSNFFQAGIDEQKNRRDASGKQLGQVASPLGCNVSSALGVDHKTNGIGAGFNASQNIGFSSEAANFDRSVVHD
jgi:hypothetical protein